MVKDETRAEEIAEKSIKMLKWLSVECGGLHWGRRDMQGKGHTGGSVIPCFPKSGPRGNSTTWGLVRNSDSRAPPWDSRFYVAARSPGDS